MDYCENLSCNVNVVQINGTCKLSHIDICKLDITSFDNKPAVMCTNTSIDVCSLYIAVVSAEDEYPNHILYTFFTQQSIFLLISDIKPAGILLYKILFTINTIFVFTQ